MFTTAKYGTAPSQLAISDVSNFDQRYARGYIKTSGQMVVRYLMHNAILQILIFYYSRLPEMYLIYAEAVLRGGTGGDATTALGCLNLIRARAGATLFNASDLSPATTGLQNILNERGRGTLPGRTQANRFGAIQSFNNRHLPVPLKGCCFLYSCWQQVQYFPVPPPTELPT